MNFGSLNLIILKKKFKNTTKYHNIFTISSFLESKLIFFFLEKCYIHNCGAKGSGDSGPLHIKSKAHVEEEEMSEDKQRESRLPGYTTEDDPVLDRPKSQKGKAPCR